MSASLPSMQEIARCLGGHVAGNSVIAPGPNHKPGDRSMVVTLSPTAPDGFLVHTFSPRDNDLSCKDYVRKRIGAEQWKPNGSERPKLRIVPPARPRVESDPIEDVLLSDAIRKHTPPEHRVTDHHWLYKDASGAAILAVARYNPVAGGGKTFRPFISLDGNIVSKFPYPRPLYGLDRLAARPDDPVLIVEGEKTADAAGDLIPGYVVVTSPGGANAAESADWSPLVERNVTIWPDNNDAGRGYARDIERLVPQAKTVALPKSLPEDWDLADEAPADLDIGPLLLGCDKVEVEQKRVFTAPIISEGPRLLARCAADIEPEPISWIWESRIARGKLTVIGGDPEEGKSQIGIYIAATLSRGGPWPNNEGQAPVGSVIILSAEDGAEDTLIPRLIAAGAERRKIHLIDAVKQEGDKGRRTFSLQIDLELLEAKITQLGDVAAVIIDPASAYLGSKIDSHNDQSVRTVLAPVAEMASRLDVAIISIMHFNKGNSQAGTKVMHRFMASIAFVAAARIGFAAVRDPEDDRRHLFLHAKNNLAEPAPGLAYRIEQAFVTDERIKTSHIVWDVEAVSITAAEAMAAKRGEATAPSLEEAKQFLAGIIGCDGTPVKDIEKEAKEACLSWATVKRAKDALKIRSERDGYGSAGAWRWKMT